MPYCFDVKFRTARPIGADKLEEVFKPRAFKRPLRLYRPDGMNRHEGWLAVESCGYADFAEARAGGARLQEALLITAAKRKVGVEFYVCGAVEAIHVYPGGQFELRDPGLPLPTILSDQELKEMVVAAVESATSLKTNQRVTAELLNDSFFKMSPEASFLVRVSTVEALCPQADQTENFRGIVDSVLASIPEDASAPDRDRLAKRQSVRSAYKSKIKQLFGDDKADKFDALYGLRSNFLHDGSGRDSLGDAADATLEMGLQLLLADIAHSAAPSEANQVNSQGTSPMPDRIISRKADGCVFEVASVLIGTNYGLSARYSSPLPPLAVGNNWKRNILDDEPCVPTT